MDIAKRHEPEGMHEKREGHGAGGLRSGQVPGVYKKGWLDSSKQIIFSMIILICIF